MDGASGPPLKWQLRSVGEVDTRLQQGRDGRTGCVSHRSRGGRARRDFAMGDILDESLEPGSRFGGAAHAIGGLTQEVRASGRALGTLNESQCRRGVRHAPGSGNVTTSLPSRQLVAARAGAGRGDGQRLLRLVVRSGLSEGRDLPGAIEARENVREAVGDQGRGMVHDVEVQVRTVRAAGVAEPPIGCPWCYRSPARTVMLPGARWA